MIKNKIILFKVLVIASSFLFLNSRLQAQKKIEDFSGEPLIVDASHYSHVFGEIRKYRIFLPAGYLSDLEKRYPVIYFLHGWSQRYFGPVGDNYSNYDKGDDNDGDNISNFVSSHDVIIVKLDGYNRYPDEEYYLNPYNLGEVESFRQFPIYFPEFVDFIDSKYRTIADRAHRAISGLSMGGFMTFLISGKYPHLVSAAGNFCGSPEFFVGPLKFPVEYRNMDMYNNYAGINVRMHYGDKDNLRFYHQDMNRIWTRVMDNYQYKIYNAAHTTCGLGDMFEFILKTFEDPPERPAQWDHIDIYPEFSIWDYKVISNRFRPGFTILENVDKRGFKSSVRTFLPDGELLQFVDLSVTTPPIYEKNQLYIINDFSSKSLKPNQYMVRSDDKGILKINIDGRIHNIGINRPNDSPNICIASIDIENMNWATIREKIEISVKLLNKGLSDAEGVKVKLSATNEIINILDSASDVGEIPVNEIKPCSNRFTFYVASDDIEISKFKLRIYDKSGHEWQEYFEIPLRNKQPQIKDYQIADGKTFTVAKAGIDSVSLMLGQGNGDGIPNPGESIVILVKDRGRFWRTNLYSSDQYINPFGINIRASDNWAAYDHINGSAKSNMPLISSKCPENHNIKFFAEYWLPENKDHIITKGEIDIQVTGTDTTPPIVRWIHVSADNTIHASIYDGSNIQQVIARFISVPDVKGLDYVDLKDPKKKFALELNDENLDGDMAAGDFVFSKRIPEQSAYFYRVEIEAMDSFGNRNIEKWPDVFIIY